VSSTAWHFDEEIARASAAFHAPGFDKQDQFIDWQDRYWVDGGARIYFHGLHWIDDGQTFEVHPVYRARYPMQHNGRGPRWLKAGRPVGNSGQPIHVRDVNGPLVAVGPNRLRFQFDALNPAGTRMRAFFIAYSNGDGQYRYTEHVGFPPRNFSGLTQGADQTISFPPIRDVPIDSGPVTLRAISDSGLRVEYYVDFGPAKIDGDKLVVTDVPVRSRFPIQVKVTAYQFGRGIEPRVKSAQPVSQVFRITK
jgi:hypothetical protein